MKDGKIKLKKFEYKALTKTHNFNNKSKLKSKHHQAKSRVLLKIEKLEWMMEGEKKWKMGKLNQ